MVYEGHTGVVADLALSDEEELDSSISQDSHQRGFGEAAARGFYPISEETMDVTALSRYLSTALWLTGEYEPPVLLSLLRIVSIQ